MGIFTKLDKHANLVNRMADAVHADLGAALVEHRLTGHELRAAILSCTNCTRPDDCRLWLDAHPNGSEKTPSYCRNSDLMARLAS